MHNGIIENHEALRSALSARGYVLTSPTDTNAHLVVTELRTRPDLFEALLADNRQLVGAYTPAVIDERQPGKVVVASASASSPRLFSLIEDGAHAGHYAAPYASALLQVTRELIYLENGDIAELTARPPAHRRCQRRGRQAPGCRLAAPRRRGRAGPAPPIHPEGNLRAAPRRWPIHSNSTQRRPTPASSSSPSGNPPTPPTPWPRCTLLRPSVTLARWPTGTPRNRPSCANARCASSPAGPDDLLKLITVEK